MNESPFSSQVIAKSVHDSLDEAFAQIPENRKHVVMIDATATKDDQRAKLLFAQRMPKGWNVMLGAAWDHEIGFGGKVGVLKSW